jgi:tricorn protease
MLPPRRPGRAEPSFRQVPRIMNTSRLRHSLALLLLAASSLPAQTRLLRTPTVSATQVAFAYANNIWVASRDGGDARRLTTFQGQTGNPKFSPDGKLLAFSAQYGGNIDAYVVAADGGEPRRLTFHPGVDEVQGWSPDGKRVVFASNMLSPNGSPRFFSVGLDGGNAEPLPMPRAYQGKYSPDGKQFAYRMNNSWDDERRNYRGGQNRPIWILDLASYDLVSPPWTDSKDIDPVWVGDVVYFISDRDGVQNVWSYASKTKMLEQVTRFRDFDVKSLDAGAGVLAFEQAGYIHTWDPKSRQEKRLDITVRGDFPWMMPQWKDVSARVTSIAISSTGKRAAAEARGEVFTIPAEKGDWRNLSNASGSAERAPAWSPDGKFVSYFSDRSGEYQLVIAPQDGIAAPRVIDLPDPTFYYTPSWSPDGKRIVYSDADLRVWWVDVATGKATKVEADLYMDPDRSLNPVWSPDSRWIAYARRLPSLYHAIFVHNVETGATRQLTDGLSDATWPAWDANGKYLYFLASTNFALKTGWLDMSNYERPVTRAIYAAVLRKGDASPLLPESDDEGGPVNGEAKPAPTPPGAPPAATPPPGVPRADSAAARRPPAAVPVTIDFDGVMQRVISLGLAERDYVQLRSAATGTLFFVENVPVVGTVDPPTGGFGVVPGGTLHRYTLKERKAMAFATGILTYAVSQDGKKILTRAGGPQGGLAINAADGAVPAAGAGRLTASIRMLVDPKAEFRQMFTEGWRNQKNYLYVENLQGADYRKVKAMYEPLLAHVMHRDDLNFLLDYMGSEISIGHSYVRGGDLPEVPQANVGLLGADYAVSEGRYRIARIYNGENWNPTLRAPLSTPGVDVSAGDYLLAVNGAELRATESPYRLFEGTANRQTVITVNSRPTMDGARRVTVVPVASDQALRNRDWIEGNRRKVDSLSAGKLAYVYIPNTGQPGYASFNRYYFAQQDRPGVILDERFNGGGSLADYIIEVLQRDFDGYFNNRVEGHRPFTSPAAGIWGPKVMIVNEMAGSGGDAMPYMFKRRKIGSLVGKRTWGGLVGTWDTPVLVDGGTMIAPRGGFFDRDGKWAVENEGVAPDIDVENWPKDVIAGRDPQLERAVTEALRLLKEKPVVLQAQPAAPIRARVLP